MKTTTNAVIFTAATAVYFTATAVMLPLHLVIVYNLKTENSFFFAPFHLHLLKFTKLRSLRIYI